MEGALRSLKVDGGVTASGYAFLKDGAGDRAIYHEPFVILRSNTTRNDETALAIVYTQVMDNYAFVPGNLPLPAVDFDTSVQSNLADGRKTLFREYFPNGITSSMPYIIRDITDPLRPAVYRDLNDVQVIAATQVQTDIEVSRERLSELIVDFVTRPYLTFRDLGADWGFNEAAVEWSVVLLLCGGVSVGSLCLFRNRLGAAGFVFLLMAWMLTYMQLIDPWLVGIILLLMIFPTSYIIALKFFGKSDPDGEM